LLVQAIGFIREHATEPIRVEDVLRVVPLSRRSLERACPHLVVIEGFESPGPQGLGPDESPKPLFREYRTKVDLPRHASTQNFEVVSP
jgi:hypothetical protein